EGDTRGVLLPQNLTPHMRINLLQGHTVKGVLRVRSEELMEVTEVCNGLSSDSADPRDCLTEDEDQRVAHELSNSHVACGVDRKVVTNRGHVHDTIGT